MKDEHSCRRAGFNLFGQQLEIDSARPELGCQLYEIAEEENRPYVNSTYLQPFISYTTKTKTTFGVNTESTYDWRAYQWLVPINFYVSQLFKIGKLPLSLQIGVR